MLFMVLSIIEDTLNQILTLLSLTTCCSFVDELCLIGTIIVMLTVDFQVLKL